VGPRFESWRAHSENPRARGFSVAQLDGAKDRGGNRNGNLSGSCASDPGSASFSSKCRDFPGRGFTKPWDSLEPVRRLKGFGLDVPFVIVPPNAM
jgi:hypothetical protein